MIQEEAALISNRQIATDYFELRFRVSKEVSPEPGQFLTLRVAEGPVPLLRRPFAFSSYESSCGAGEAGIIYQRRGAGTELLAGKQEGDTIDIIAPLGNSWPLPREGETAVLAAGGIGIGPLIFLARRLKESGRPFILIIGARSSRYLPESSVVSRLDPLFATDDGSTGVHGTVVDAFPHSLPGSVRLYACGPERMMQAVHHKALELDAPCHVSMEQTIACGVGACMGCVIRLAGEERYARVCADGPIFDSRDLAWT
jgi:dihydroorotate dehydrogenase electron transfer subunit